VATAFAVHAAVWGSFSARLPALKHGLGIGDGRVGLALFVMAVATVAGTRVAPLAVSRFGSRDLVRLGTLFFCVALIGPAVASSYAWFGVALALLGGLGGLLDVAFNVQGVAVQRAYGRPILAGLHGVWSVALFAGGATGALAAAAGVSPTWQFALVGAVLALASARLLAWQLPPADEPPVPAEVSHLPLSRVLALGAIGFAAFVGEGAAADWSAIYARDSLGAGSGAAAVAFAAFGVAMAVARFTGDRATSRFGPVRLVGAGGVVAATGYALVVAVPHLAAVYAGFALVGLGLGAVVPVVFSASGAPGALGRVVTLSYVGSIAGPAAIGLAAEAAGLRAALVIPLVLCAGIAAGARVVR
jgi:predicted MFS family arabinose efflux permease